MIYHPRVLQLNTQDRLRAELLKVGAESSSLEELGARSTFRLVKLDRISLPLARLLYQELVMEGGQVVTPPRLEHVGPGTTPALLCATRYQFDHLIVRLRWQENDELDVFADELERVLDNFDSPRGDILTLGPSHLEWGARTYIMGIVNVTPDSFSGDGIIQPGDQPPNYVARAVSRARRMAEAGADIIDIGGESTHPGAQPVDAATERARVVPVIETLARQLAVPISIDTYKGEVAREALQAGAVLVNDVWGLGRDPTLKKVVADADAAVVINHNWLGAARTESADFIGDIIYQLRERVESAVEVGIKEARIIVDPGLGFGKTLAENLELLDRLGELRSLGLPILIGPSRKGFINRVLHGDSAGEAEAADEGTAAVVALGITRGADIVRVHNVKSAAGVARMTDAIVRRLSATHGAAHDERPPK